MDDSNVVSTVGDLRDALEMTNETDQIMMNFEVVVSVFNDTADIIDDETPLNETTVVRAPYSMCN